MAIMCLNCGYVETGASGLHTFSKCPSCKSTERDKFIRVDTEDFNSEKHKIDKEYLESHKINE